MNFSLLDFRIVVDFVKSKRMTPRKCLTRLREGRRGKLKQKLFSHSSVLFRFVLWAFPGFTQIVLVRFWHLVSQSAGDPGTFLLMVLSENNSRPTLEVGCMAAYDKRSNSEKSIKTRNAGRQNSLQGDSASRVACLGPVLGVSSGLIQSG